MLSKLIRNNLPYVCSQVLGTEKGKIAYPYVKAIFDLVASGNYQNVLSQISTLLALEGVSLLKP